MNTKLYLAPLMLCAALQSEALDLEGIIDGSDGFAASPDGTYVYEQCQADTAPIQRMNEGYWIEVNLTDEVNDGTAYTCANGSDYKFFVQYNTGATNLTVTLEPGGGCWDFETCTNRAGVLNVKTLGPIPSDAMASMPEPRAALYPHLGRVDNNVATNKYNHVFFPYCTGDAFSGDTTNTYTSDNGSITVSHHGHRNIMAAMDWLSDNFAGNKTGQLLVLGSSAGGIGSMINYPFIRDAVNPKCSSLVADSGVIFPPGGPQEAMAERLVSTWKLSDEGAILDKLDAELYTATNRSLNDDIANIMYALGLNYSDDRFLLTAFKEDLIFSSFSFTGSGVVAPGPNMATELLDLWQDELDYLVYWTNRFDGTYAKNWGYYFPTFRFDFCSHTLLTSGLGQLNKYNGDAIAGNMDSYWSTELGSELVFQDYDGSILRKRNFRDVLVQLLDVSQPIPRFEGDVDPDQITFTHTNVPSTSFEEDWQNDWYETRFVGLDLPRLRGISEKQAWVESMIDYQNPGSCVSSGIYQAN